MGGVRISRRGFLGSALAGIGLRLNAQEPRTPLSPPRVRTGPILCLDSRLVPLEYSQLSTVLSALGFDGCDLSVQPGSTVSPDQSPVDMVRSIETITGDGFEVPVITTAFVNVGEPWARNVLALSGRSGVSYFRSGYSKATPDRIVQRRNDILGLMSYGRAAGIILLVPYPAAEPVVRDLDPQWIGYHFDPSQGDLAAVLPRMRMVVLRDVRREGDELVPCPLGKGTVDWPAFFAALAKARFSGPLTLTLDYSAPDRLQALKQDAAFARQQINAAYQKELEKLSLAGH